MIQFKNFYPSKKVITSIGLTIGIFNAPLIAQAILPKEALANPSFFEHRWQDTGNYRKLYYHQGSKGKRDRSTYYLVMRAKDRKTAILKLSINFPKHFDSTITPKKFSLCKVALGGMLERTRCTERLPAIVEVSKDQTKVEVFPEQPIPTTESYALVMKIFNPTKSGMFQLNALGQSPGDMPISRYIGSWSIDID